MCELCVNAECIADGQSWYSTYICEECLHAQLKLSITIIATNSRLSCNFICQKIYSFLK